MVMSCGDGRNEITDTSGGNEFPLNAFWALPLEMESGAATPVHRRGPAEVAKASDRDAFEMPPKRHHPFINDNFGLPLLSFYCYYFIFIPIAFLI